MEFAKLNAVIDQMNEKQRAVWFQRVDKTGLSESQLEVLATKVLQGEIKESLRPLRGEEIEENVKSLHEVLQEKLESMNESQHRTFLRVMKERKGGSVESKIAFADHVLANKPVKVRETITRNNGPDMHPVSEAQAKMNEAESRFFRQMGMKAEDVDRFHNDGLPKEIREASPQVQADYKFLRQINISERDAVRGALENVVRGGRRSIALKD